MKEIVNNSDVVRIVYKDGTEDYMIMIVGNIHNGDEIASFCMGYHCIGPYFRTAHDIHHKKKKVYTLDDVYELLFKDENVKLYHTKFNLTQIASYFESMKPIIIIPQMEITQN